MSRNKNIVRTTAIFGIAAAQLRRSPGRTALTVLAVAVAVLSVTLLASLGVGVVDVGEESLGDADRDLWLTAEGSETDNGIVDASEVAASIDDREDVRTAAPIALHDVYLGSDEGELRRVPAVGVHETHRGYGFQEGDGFELEPADYRDAPRSDSVRSEIVLDPRTAAALDVSVGGTVRIGASREHADREFTVVGTSAHHSTLLGEPAATVPLADLQYITGTSGTDRATFVMADTTDDADGAVVRDEIQEEYPEYAVRTSDEQVEMMLTDRPVVIASGATLVGLAVVGSTILLVNLFVLVAYQQRDELAALRAIGLSQRLLAATIGAQGLFVGIFGGLLGIAATPLLRNVLNRVAASTVGIEGLLITPTEVYVAGFALALALGGIVAVVTGWHAGRYAQLERLNV
ncbi:ABC transporter permease [Natranaeroarchaeum aerophilus]|uniref:ABC transporter permease n=1 Tax=Natranaeroarchaeum aerophilus TaxID=2917711 RepID=A0AAE3FR85_9EURY|nr:ABC transporter permease [Natranaeroarchaeum aerophilus]MCL9813676.1 ABC transporter permease [Natranaeroarchaeum aerophilus]